MRLQDINYYNFHSLLSKFNCNHFEQNLSIVLAGKLRRQGLSRLVDFSRQRARGAIQNLIRDKIRK